MNAPAPSLVRAWAIRAGVPCPARGRIPAVVIDAYLASPRAQELQRDVLPALRELEARGQLAPRTRSGYGYAWRQFTSWCRRHTVTALPADEDTVLAYLHVHLDRWSWGTMYQHVNAINKAHSDNGHVSPCGPAVSLYLAAVSRSKGRRAELHKVDALLGEQAAQVTQTALPVRYIPAVLSYRARTVLLLVRTTGHSLRAFTGLAVSDITVDEAGASLAGTADVRITRTWAPDCPVAGLEQLLAALPSDATLLLGVRVERAENTVRVDAAHDRTWTHRVTQDSLRQLFRRIRATAQWSPVRPGYDLDDATFQRALEMSNPSYLLELRARTYMLLGLATGRRHDELEHADIEHLRLDDDGDGYVWLFPKSKTDQEGAGFHRRLDHSDGGCDLTCAACMLALWLDALKRHCGYSSGPLFPALGSDSRPRGRLERGNAQRILGNAVRDGGVALPRVGTRSLRAGTATTLARDQGLEAAADITGHRTLKNLLEYVRPLDSFTHQWHLPV